MRYAPHLKQDGGLPVKFTHGSSVQQRVLLQAEYDQRPNILFVLLLTRTLFWERTIYFTETIH